MWWMWYFVGVGLLGVVLIFIVFFFFDLFFVQQFENFKSEEVFQVFGVNGEVIGWYYIENWVFVIYDQLLFNLVNVFIFMEDECYYEYSGIDFVVLGWIVVKIVLFG